MQKINDSKTVHVLMSCNVNITETNRRFYLLGPCQLGRWTFNSVELESINNYFQGVGEQAHNFGWLGSTIEKCFWLLFSILSFLLGTLADFC